jgi:two-component system NarL family sensor kinase
MMGDDGWRKALPSQGLPSHLRSRIVTTFLVLVLAACLTVTALLLSRAVEERRSIRDRALSTAVALSYAFDQEVAAVNYLLKGLSRSPAFQSGDFKGFYDQIKATPIPEGTWLVLQDLVGQVFNTLRPFGDPGLPKHSEAPNSEELLKRVRERGWTVSGRLYGLVAQRVVVALSLRIDGADGDMKHFITTVLSDQRLFRLLDDHRVPDTWMKGIFDRKLEPIVASLGSTLTDKAGSAGLGAILAKGGPNDTVDGLAEDVDMRGTPVLVAYRHSGTTNWTAVVEVPLAIVNAPINDVMAQIAGAAILLVLAAVLAALLTTRQVEEPIRFLSQSVTVARREIEDLSAQLLALQEEERQCIARELHDSTAQHLVAMSFGLMRIGNDVKGNPTASKACMEMEVLLDQALKELRIFTYLLHPPNLATEGLKATLRDFVDGFSSRTNLNADVKVPDGIDDLPFELQRSLLRVVQEALANINRHAHASSISLTARLGSRRLSLRIRDDGRGVQNLVSGTRGERQRMGVGIPGMRARLQQFGGDLKIRSGPDGTTVLATVPLPDKLRPLSRAGLTRSALSSRFAGLDG